MSHVADFNKCGMAIHYGPVTMTDP